MVDEIYLNHRSSEHLKHRKEQAEQIRAKKNKLSKDELRNKKRQLKSRLESIKR